MSEAKPVGASLRERLGGSVTLAASLLGLVVTLNTVITSCSRERVTEASEFRKLVQGEEEFWSKLYDKYLAAVEVEPADGEKRRTKLLAVAQLASHQTPDFDEYHHWYGSLPSIGKASEHLAKMRQVLSEALRDPRSSSPGIAEEIAFLLDSKSELRQREAAKPGETVPPEVTGTAANATSIAQAAQAAAPPVLDNALPDPASYSGSKILASGSPKGWDLDVFWCAGPGEAVNLKAALDVGNALAGAAQTGAAVARGVIVGRVRLRSLSLSAQQSGGFYIKEPAIVFDSAPGEDAAARAFAALAQANGSGRLRLARSNSAQTTWYLSLFMCNTPGAPRGGLAAEAIAAEAAAEDATAPDVAEGDFKD